MNIIMKYCNGCKEELSVKEFGKENKKGILPPRCKRCTSKQRKEYRKACKKRNESFTIEELRVLTPIKRCSKCSDMLKSILFTKDVYTKDGLCAVCLNCASLRGRDVVSRRRLEYKKLTSQEIRNKTPNKKCSVCKEYKSSDVFNVSRSSSSGLYHMCKECCSEYKKIKREKYTRINNRLTSKEIRNKKINQCCNICKQIKNSNEFSINKSRSGGLSNICKKCDKVRLNELGRKNTNINKNLDIKKIRERTPTKICIVCDRMKGSSEYHIFRRSKDGLGNTCKSCKAIHSKNLRSKYESQNSKLTYDEIKKRVLKKKCFKCKEFKAGFEFGINISNRDGLSSLCKSCKSEDHKKRFEDDIQYRIASNLRRRLLRAVKQGSKSGSAVRDLGCTIPEFKIYIATKFYSHPITGEEMTWDNYGHGKGNWQIHHIKSLSSFDLEDRGQFLEAVHYTNMEPLWFEDHNKKHRKRK